MRHAESRPSEAFYSAALRSLRSRGVPFMIGGAYAMREHAGIIREPKDLDIFCCPEHVSWILDVLGGIGCRIERTYPRWLAKAFCEGSLIDIIFSSGNGRCRVDPAWERHAREATVVGVQVKIVPPEEMIWSKAYVQDRLRFDGADVAHLIRRHGRTLDWRRLLERMDSDWEVLFAHLVNFRFIYPSESGAVPAWVIGEMSARLNRQLARPNAAPQVCRGRMLTPHDYEIDITEWGYGDGSPSASPWEHGHGSSRQADNREDRRVG